MPEMSGKCKSNEANPTKSNHLIYIMIFFEGGGEKKILKNPYFNALRVCLNRRNDK